MGLSILSKMPLPCFIRLPSGRVSRAQDAVLTAGALRLTGWRPYAVCDQPPGHCRACTLSAHTASTNPGQPHGAAPPLRESTNH